MSRFRLLVACALVAACSASAGCATSARHPGRPEAVPGPAPVVSSADSSTRRSLEGVADDPRSRLQDVRVARLPGGRLRVAAAWTLCPAGRCRHSRVVVSSDDGFRTRQVQRFRPGLLDALVGPRPAAPTPSDSRLVAASAVSLRRGVVASVAGGDGATLLPFEMASRSIDGGRTWTSYDVPLTRGERGYVTGQVVLPGGRLLVLLDAWSGDRPDRPSGRHHGLWVSNGSDWSTWSAFEPTFAGPVRSSLPGRSAVTGLGGSASGAGVVWVRTADDRVQVSTDGAVTFEEVPVR